MENEVKVTRQRWRTRRFMAWGAFWYLLFQVPILAVLVSAEWVVAASGIVIGVSTALAAIITIYIGAATYDDVKNGT